MKREWSALDGLLGLGIVVAIAGVIGLLLLPLDLLLEEGDPLALGFGALGTVGFEFGLVAVVYWFAVRRGAKPEDVGLTRAGWKWWFPVVALGACYVVLWVYMGVVSAIGEPRLEPAAQLPVALFDYPAVLVLVGVSVVFVAPVTEELFFRGFLFRSFSNTLGVVFGAVASGFIFSLAHANLGAIVPFTLIGAILALSYHYSGTILTPIATHFAFNLISFSVLVLVPESRL